MMEEQQKPRKALAPPPPPGYVLVSDAKPLIHKPQNDFYYWAALARHNFYGVGLLLYTSIKVIDFLIPDEAVLLHISLAGWLSTLLPYTSPEVACQIQESCSDEETQV